MYEIQYAKQKGLTMDKYLIIATMCLFGSYATAMEDTKEEQIQREGALEKPTLYLAAKKPYEELLLLRNKLVLEVESYKKYFERFAVTDPHHLKSKIDRVLELSPKIEDIEGKADRYIALATVLQLDFLKLISALLKELRSTYPLKQRIDVLPEWIFERVFLKKDLLESERRLIDLPKCYGGWR